MISIISVRRKQVALAVVPSAYIRSQPFLAYIAIHELSVLQVTSFRLLSQDAVEQSSSCESAAGAWGC